MSAAQTYDDVLRILTHIPPLESPGRGYYTNLASLIQAFKPPRAAGCEELAAYVALVQRMAHTIDTADSIIISNAVRSLRTRMRDKGCS
jgi:hypothetical protein